MSNPRGVEIAVDCRVMHEVSSELRVDRMSCPVCPLFVRLVVESEEALVSSQLPGHGLPLVFPDSLYNQCFLVFVLRFPLLF